MAVKKPVENIFFLVVDKDELKDQLKIRMQLGHDIQQRPITNETEKIDAWRSFIDWDNFNEELIRQAFDKPNNPHVAEYKFKEGIDIEVAFYGKTRSFSELVQQDKNQIAYQLRKLSWFYEKIDLQKTNEATAKPKLEKQSLNNLLNLLSRFHKIAQAIRDRRKGKGRDTILIQDEYDVQDLLYGLLQIYFDDVRKEDYSPSSAGANTRLDFVLKREKIILEIKITSESLPLKKLGEDLYIDIGRYKAYPDCNNLVIFIYDKGDFIRNKIGFIYDLENQSTPTFKVTAIINPL
jgi:REase_DpnII-MboI